MGEVPYHPKEFGAPGIENTETFMASGIVGVVGLLFMVIIAVATLVVAAPFVLLGFAEFVGEAPTRYRVRWVRHEVQSGGPTDA